MFRNTINRRNLLKGLGGLSLLPFMPRSAHANTTPKRVIMVRAFGGWDVTYCMDPKFSATGTLDGPEIHASNIGLDVESIDTFGTSAGNGGIPVMINNALRPSVENFFSSYAEQSIVVNGIYVGSIVHDRCRLRVSTGFREIGNPDFGVVAGVEHGQAGYTIPFIDITGSGFAGEYASSTCQLGFNNQILALLNRNIPIPGPLGSDITYPNFVPNNSQGQIIEDYLSTRKDLLGAEGHLDSVSAKRLADLDIASQRKESLLANRSILTNNLSFGQTSSFASQVDLAVNLLQSGFCQSIGLESGSSWDTHDDITDQNDLYEELFSGLNSLMDQLTAAGMLQDTLVVVVSEMTRTPRLNSDGGKDHWPVTSAMVLGGAIDGGKVIGVTDNSLEPDGINLADGTTDTGGNPLNYDQFVAGIVHASGADATSWMPEVEVLHGLVD